MKTKMNRQESNGKARSKKICYFCDKIIGDISYPFRGLLYTLTTDTAELCTENICEKCFAAAPSGHTINGNGSFCSPLELSL